MAEKMDRRKFLGRAGGTLAAIGGVGIIGAPEIASALNKPAAKKTAGRSARVVIARDPMAWKGDKLDEARVRDMVLRAVRALTDEKTDAAAWKKFYGAGDTVGVKINCAAGKGLSNKRESMNAVAEGLLSAGVESQNIIFWDNSRMLMMQSGFHIISTGKGPMYMGSDSIGIGYEDDITTAGEVGSRLSRMVTTKCTALLNAPLLKDHGLAGVTIGMKNYYGAVNNPNKLHDNNCDPYVADLNTMPPLRDKTKLIICDALLAQYHGGPGYKAAYTWKYGGIIVSDDPVALDAVGAKIIEYKRREVGMPSLAKEGRPPKYIQSAAKRGLGVADLKKIKVIEI